MDRKEAIEVLKDFWSVYEVGTEIREAFETLIPELKESEDERIRKAIVAFFELQDDNTTYSFIPKRNILAWLEKQKRLYSDYEESELRRGLLWHLKELRNIEKSKGLPIKAKATYDDWIAWLEKQGSQNPANSAKTCKVESKFKVGDWIVFNNDHDSIYQIEKIENYEYTLRHILGGLMPLSFSHKDMIRAWTIQDAKDGDVLAEHETIVLFKKIEGQNIRCYCTYHYLGYNPALHVDTLHNKNVYFPATQEQRDQLEKAMADAGYKWNKEELKLEKI